MTRQAPESKNAATDTQHGNPPVRPLRLKRPTRPRQARKEKAPHPSWDAAPRCSTLGYRALKKT